MAYRKLLVFALLAFGCASPAAEAPVPGRGDERGLEGSRASDPGEEAARAALHWPLHGRVSSGFGNQRSTHRHLGIDIRTATGTPILAAANGRVRFSGRMRGYGNVVILDHGDGLETRYAHNQRNLVRSAQRVEQGEAIARVGTTGNATAPHVHFEVREGGQARDPLRFLPSLPAAAR